VLPRGRITRIHIVTFSQKHNVICDKCEVDDFRRCPSHHTSHYSISLVSVLEVNESKHRHLFKLDQAGFTERLIVQRDLGRTARILQASAIASQHQQPIRWVICIGRVPPSPIVQDHLISANGHIKLKILIVQTISIGAALVESYRHCVTRDLRSISRWEPPHNSPEQESLTISVDKLQARDSHHWPHHGSQRSPRRCRYHRPKAPPIRVHGGGCRGRPAVWVLCIN